MFDDTLQEMQNNPTETIYMHLIKFAIVSYGKITISEWSTENIVQNRNKIIKEIMKAYLNNEKVELKSKYIMRLNNKKISTLMDEEYLTITKTYILIRTSVK